MIFPPAIQFAGPITPWYHGITTIPGPKLWISEEWGQRSGTLRKKEQFITHNLTSCLAIKMWRSEKRRRLCLKWGRNTCAGKEHVFVCSAVWPIGWINLVWAFSNCPLVFKLCLFRTLHGRSSFIVHHFKVFQSFVFGVWSTWKNSSITSQQKTITNLVTSIKCNSAWQKKMAEIKAFTIHIVMLKMHPIFQYSPSV